MRNRRFAYSSLAIALSFGLIAAGCGGDDGEEAGDGTTTTAGGGSDQQLVIGTLLPQTGNLAFLGPPEIAGAELAIKEINEAGGVFGQDVRLINKDSGDTSTDIASQSVDALLSDGAHAIVGAASSGVSLTVIDKITGAGVVQFSPANTAKALSTYDDNGLYFRNAPSDILQGQVLADLVAEDGHSSVAVLALQDPYGEGLAEDFQSSFEASGGEVVVKKIYDPQAANFDPEVNEVIAANPEAFVLIGFDESAKILKSMIDKGKGPKELPTYGVDGNMGNALGEQFADAPGALEGMKGTTPGINLEEAGDFKEKMLEVDPDLKDFSYGPETYDAVNIIALAALKAGTTDATVFAEEIVGITRDGEKCTTFAACKQIIEDGGDPDYDGVSGPISMLDNGDPGEATYIIHEFTADNTLLDPPARFVPAKVEE